jgi:3-hydroxybutyryl-CoA dehydrogenase
MYKSTFDQAAVLGSGMMGPGIALTLSVGGVPAVIVSRTPERAAEGLAKACAQADFLRAHGLLSEADAAAAAGRLTASADFEGALREADLVIESTPEQMNFKQELFARIETCCRPNAILTSNTSGLSITAIASRCAHPERVVTTHFWNPPHLMPLVEIVRGERTAPEVLELLRSLFTACGKTPVIVKKDRPGQLGNRLQMALLREAVNIVAEGIAEPADVDAVLKSGLGIRMPAYGTLEHIDLVGLDMGMAIVDYVTRDLNNEVGAPPFLRALVEQGHLGAKTGRGFYDWSQKSADAVKAARDAFLVEVLRYRRSRAVGA